MCTMPNKPFREHTAPIFKKLGILPYDSLIQQAKLKFMHNITYSYNSITFRKKMQIETPKSHSARANYLPYLPQN